VQAKPSTFLQNNDIKVNIRQKKYILGLSFFPTHKSKKLGNNCKLQDAKNLATRILIQKFPPQNRRKP